MQVPFIVLSYGHFATTKKLFSLERDGVHTLPIFTDAQLARQYITYMNRLLWESREGPHTLHSQLCADPKMAVQMFETITVYYPDLLKVLINPTTPDTDSLDSSWITLVDNLV